MNHNFVKGRATNYRLCTNPSVKISSVYGTILLLIYLIRIKQLFIKLRETLEKILFDLLALVNSRSHVGMVGNPNHIFPVQT